MLSSQEGDGNKRAKEREGGLREEKKFNGKELVRDFVEKGKNSFTIADVHAVWIYLTCTAIRDYHLKRERNDDDEAVRVGVTFSNYHQELLLFCEDWIDLAIWLRFFRMDVN